MIVQDRTRLAVIVVVITVFALALGDAIIKNISASFTLWQIFVFRSLMVIPVLILLIRRRGPFLSTLPKFPGWTLLRSFMLTVMWIAYYTALPHIDLSIAASAFYTLPIFITLFSWLILGDHIGKPGWIAIILGFVGVILILEPRIENFNWFALLPVLSAVLFALSMILTRSRCQTENIFILSLWLNISMLVTGMIASSLLLLITPDLQGSGYNKFLLGNWSPMGTGEWGVITVLAIAIFIGSVGAAFAYQHGPPATIATFDFAYVAFAVVWGFIFFNEIPAAKNALGMLFIIAAGVITAARKPGTDQEPIRE
jgi:drug/metabolite transporter (DMT)-like permease